VEIVVWRGPALSRAGPRHTRLPGYMYLGKKSLGPNPAAQRPKSSEWTELALVPEWNHGDLRL